MEPNSNTNLYGFPLKNLSYTDIKNPYVDYQIKLQVKQRFPNTSQNVNKSLRPPRKRPFAENGVNLTTNIYI